MTREEYCQKSADLSEEIYDIENSLEKVRTNIIWEEQKMKDGEYNQYESMIEYRDELLSKKAELESEHSQLVSDYGYLA